MIYILFTIISILFTVVFMYVKPHKFKIPIYLIIALIGIILIMLFGISLITSPNDFDFFIKDNIDSNASENTSYKYLSNNEKGDFFGGITNPLIALVGVIVTGLAFYMQYQANKLIQEQIRNQQESEELSKFENKFYELLRYHKENVNNLEFKYKDDGIKINAFGIQVIDKFITEVNSLYHTLEHIPNFNALSNIDRFKSAYYLMFYGIDNPNFNTIIDNLGEMTNYNIPDSIYNNLDIPIIYQSNTNRFVKYIIPGDEIFENGEFYDTTNEITLSLVNKYSKVGYINQVSLYMRNLYYLVKIVCKNEILNYKEKREFIRIIRSQLSTNEQILIYYNWLSGLGSEWESLNHVNRPLDNENYFLTNYRIIHNINPINIIQDLEITLETVFTEQFCNYLIENDNQDDEYLFESLLIRRAEN